MTDNEYIQKQLPLSYACMTNNYTTIDIETTGLNPNENEIIELAAARVRDGQLEEVFQSLVKPIEGVSSFVSNLTGITNEMLVDAPTIYDSLVSFLDFIGDDILVGHNIPFDLSFINIQMWNFMGCDLPNLYLDTLPMAKKIHPEFHNHKLCTIVNELGISNPSAHRALGDACTTYECFEIMKAEIIENNINIDALQIPQNKNSNTCKTHDFYRTGREAQYATAGVKLDCVDEISFNNSRFALTGECEELTRAEIIAKIEQLGGYVSNISKQTAYLVVGKQNLAVIKDTDNAKSNKILKGEELRRKGCDIKIISYENLLECLECANNV